MWQWDSDDYGEWYVFAGQYQSDDSDEWYVFAGQYPPSVSHAALYKFRLVPRAWLNDPDGVDVWYRHRPNHGLESAWLYHICGEMEWDHEHYEYDIRPKRRTITLPAREIPEPLREIPHGGECYVIDPTKPAGSTYISNLWKYSNSDRERWLRRGLLYRTAEDAASARRAMYPIQGDE